MLYAFMCVYSFGFIAGGWLSVLNDKYNEPVALVEVHHATPERLNLYTKPIYPEHPEQKRFTLRGSMGR